MAIIPLPLPPGTEARALLHHILEHGDVVGTETADRNIVQLAVDEWIFEKLLTFDTDAVELEDEGDGEPDDDSERMAHPLVLLEVVRLEVVRSLRCSTGLNLSVEAGPSSWTSMPAPPPS